MVSYGTYVLGVDMKITVQTFPKTVPIALKQFKFTTEYQITVGDSDNLFSVVIWCYENFGDVNDGFKVEYYPHGKDRWFSFETISYLKEFETNTNDYIRVSFTDETDFMAFKLRWT